MSDQQPTTDAPSATATAPPPPVAPPPAPAGTSPAPPRKRHGCLIALGIALVLLIAAVGAGFALVSSAGKPRDLGVTYTEADYWSAVKKAGVKEASEQPFTGDLRYTGKKKVDVVYTPSEISALLNYSHQPGWPISDAQVRFSGTDGVEISAAVEVAGTKYPVYAQGTAGISGGVVSGMATSAQVFGVSVPSQYLGPGSEYLVGIVNARLRRLGSLDITTAEIVDGGLHLVGTGPAAAEPAAGK